MARKTIKVPIAERALFARVDRKLNQEGERLRRCREDSSSFHQLGRYFIVSIEHGGCNAADVDLEGTARELGVMRDYETLAD